MELSAIELEALRLFRFGPVQVMWGFEPEVVHRVHRLHELGFLSLREKGAETYALTDLGRTALHADQQRRFQPSEEWLLKMAEKEDGCCTSVGGLAVELGLYHEQSPPNRDGLYEALVHAAGWAKTAGNADVRAILDAVLSCYEDKVALHELRLFGEHANPNRVIEQQAVTIGDALAAMAHKEDDNA